MMQNDLEGFDKSMDGGFLKSISTEDLQKELQSRTKEIDLKVYQCPNTILINSFLERCAGEHFLNYIRDCNHYNDKKNIIASIVALKQALKNESDHTYGTDFDRAYASTMLQLNVLDNVTFEVLLETLINYCYNYQECHEITKKELDTVVW